MQLPRSVALAPGLVDLESCGSTNTELMARAAASELPDFSVLVTGNQTDGRGRLGRTWVAPPGQALAISVLLRPGFGVEHYGWLPLVAGLAMTTSVAAIVPSHDVALKWPNDVQVDGLKISGLLAELLPDASGVVIGAGVNLSIATADLPTTVSTSLSLNSPIAAEPELADLVLSGYLAALRSLLARLVDAGGDAAAAGIRSEVTAACSTLGRAVKVQLPGAPDLFGRAVRIDESGRLVVEASDDGRMVAVAAGDVTHVRYE